MLDTFNDDMILAAVQEQTVELSQVRAKAEAAESAVSALDTRVDDLEDLEIPTPEAADAGKVLTVDSEGDYELSAVPTEVPTPVVADAGKVLTVDSEGDYELATPESQIMIVNVSAITPITTTEFQGTADKTYTEIYNALSAGIPVFFKATLGTRSIFQAINGYGASAVGAHFVVFMNNTWFMADYSQNEATSTIVSFMLTALS